MWLSHIPSWISNKKVSTLLEWTHFSYGLVKDFFYRAPDGESQNCSDFSRILFASFLSVDKILSFKKRMMGSIRNGPSSMQKTSYFSGSSILGLGRNSIKKGLGASLSTMEAKPTNSSAQLLSSRPICCTRMA